MAKARTSVEVKRQALLKGMTAASKDRTAKVVRFANNDVPSFLVNLDRFQAWSRRTRPKITVK